MKQMHQSEDSHIIPMTSVAAGTGHEVAADVYYYTNQIVNVIFIGKPGGRWFLVDAGMPAAGETIIDVAEKRFGRGARPEAILLTHGHFDHVGSIVHLLEHWDNVPVYAHPDEFAFLTGRQAYPEPDPGVEGGGFLAKISGIYPHQPIDITPVLLPLPPDQTVPGLTGWQWLHTPGHAPGHVSFFREADRVLIAGDAFVTVRQDAFFKVLTQRKEVCGPPPYLTTDWHLAWKSVQLLASLLPKIAVTGHGQYMEGIALAQGLNRLAAGFDAVALPKRGKYVKESDKQRPEL